MKLLRNLTFQVVTAIIIAIVIGGVWPDTAVHLKPLGDLFINLIKMLIAPIIFLTVVLGIGKMGDLKKVGRIGGKAILYFEVVTTFTLVIAVIVANLVKPGNSVAFASLSAGDVSQYTQAAAQMHWTDFFMHIVPTNFFDAFAKGDILQILFFSILFGIGLTKTGTFGHALLNMFEKLSLVFFEILGIIMKLAPLGALGGMAYTIGKFGLRSIFPMIKLMSCVYGTMLLFIFGVLYLVLRYYRVSIFKFLGYIKEELLLVLGTSSSESVLPQIMEKLERFGCSRPVVGLVIPTGYSFNLDGTTIYMAMSTIFLAQVFHIHLTITHQLSIILILMLTSKGAAGVTGSGFIVLASTLAATKVIPVEGMAVLLGVDRFMSESRAITNLIGNGVATIFIANNEKEFDRDKMEAALRGDEVADDTGLPPA